MRIYRIVPLLAVIGTLGCTQVEWKEIQSIKPGYLAFSDSSQVSLTLTREEGSTTVLYDPVDIRLRFYITSQTAEFSGVGIEKVLQNESYEPVARVVQSRFTQITDTLAVDVLSGDSLFRGLDFHPDSIAPGYSFLFRTFMVMKTGDTLFSSRGDYTVTPQYLNFCTLPEIPTGVWEAHNKATGFKKDIEILNIELAPGYFMHVFTDFGLDWSRWNDFWYGTDFSLGCPLAGDDRFVVKLAAWGIDLAFMRIEMKNDLGDPETRPLRIMPWTYADDSPDIGYYDATARQFIFKNVKVRDTWWNIDNSTISEVTFTYKGQ